MRRLSTSSLVLIVLASFALAVPTVAHDREGDQGDQNDQGDQGEHHHHHRDRPHRILGFQTMYGVDGPFVGDANPIGGIPGDELPWEIVGFARGHLDTDGQLFIVVRGLVFKDDPSVPPELRGTNDETEFRGAVACLTEDGDAVVPRTVVTEGFPANAQGDSKIQAHLDLPNPCVAPVILILAGSEDKWFSVTGFEAEEDE